MKHLRGFISSLVAGAVALAMVSTVAAQTATTGRAKVVKMKGQARFTTGNGVWQPLKVGDVLKPGSVIQTAMEKGSYVDIVLGDGSGTPSAMSEAGGAASPASPTPVSNYKSKGQQNLVRIYENSALGLDKLTSMKTGADEVTETQLDLRAGRILGNVKKMSAASKYEIKLPNGVAGIRGTIYEISAEGVVKVADGSVVIAYMAADGSVTTKVVTGGNKFDARTGEITALTPAELASMRSIETAGTVTVQVSAPGANVPLALDKTPNQQSVNGALLAPTSLSQTRAALCCSGFFVFLRGVKLKPFKRVPVFIAGGVVLFVCILRVINPGLFQRLEAITYDSRVRAALKFPQPTATNLGFIFINEDSLKLVLENPTNGIGFSAGLYWPRHAYGRLIQELTAQGASAVAFDIIWGELRPDQGVVETAEGLFPTSDVFCAGAMRGASNVIIAITRQVTPPPLFITNAMALGDINTDKDPDGALRRVQIFRPWRKWHWAFRQIEENAGFTVDEARIQASQIVLTNRDREEMNLPLDAEGNFDLADIGGDNLPAGVQRKNKPFVEQRVWHMGVVLAAKQLGLDLEHPEINFERGYVKLRGTGGVERTIPIDRDGYAYVDWSMPPNHPQLTQEAIHDLLLQHHQRIEGNTNNLRNRWRGKLAVVGSSAIIGNNLTDRGATPLSEDTILVSKHWNVANSVVTGNFIRRATLPADLALIVALGAVTAALTWQLRIRLATTFVALLAASYVLLCYILFIRARLWLPIVFPAVVQVLMSYVSLMTWRVVFERTERKRVTEIFGTVVSKKILNELLEHDNLSLGGSRREITVLFADVRGFTEFTDRAQEEVEDYVRKSKLSGSAAESLYDEQARETLATVNLYLGLVADTIIKHDATLDKFIGDCVMAFWGAPTGNPRHALACVRGAIEAQRAIYNLNSQREEQNRQRDIENSARASAGLPSLPKLPLLLLGSGINTGMATAGLMGSAGETRNYTVFGREVNLASRLEGLSGRGRVFISETTYQHLLRDDPALAATCVAQPPQKVKGIATMVKVYEVPWRPPDAPAAATDLVAKASSDSTVFTPVQSGHGS